jgi:hypothetical protein
LLDAAAGRESDEKSSKNAFFSLFFLRRRAGRL